MGKKTPSPPAPPDPVKTAAAQSQINKETAIAQSQLNAIDEHTPYGSSVYSSTDPLTEDGTPRLKRTATLDPAQQEILDRQNQVNLSLNTLASEQVGRVDDTLANEFSYSGMPQGGSTYDLEQTERSLRDQTNARYDLQAGKSPAPTSRGIGQSAAAANAAVGRATESYGTPFDYSLAPASPEADAAARQQVIDSVYGQFASRLDPRFEDERTAHETKLANSGIARGTEAFSKAIESFDRGRNDAYQSAQNAALQAGGAEQDRLFGLSTSARRNAIAEQNFLRGLPAAEQQQLLGMQGDVQGMRGTVFDAQGNVRDRQIQEQLRQRQTPMQEAQNLATMQTGLFGLQGQDRQRAIEEAAYIRNLPLNETSALMSGTQIQNPTFGAATPTGIANTDYSGLVQNNYNQQLNAYNRAQANKGSAFGAITGMAGALMGGPVGGQIGSAVGGMFGGGGGVPYVPGLGSGARL